jgi:hypothetical protein
MAFEIARRTDINPVEGLREFGDVPFADPTNHVFPVDTPEHVRAAWTAISQQGNAAKYRAEDVAIIKERIRQAAQAFRIEVGGDRNEIDRVTG